MCGGWSVGEVWSGARMAGLGMFTGGERGTPGQPVMFVPGAAQGKPACKTRGTCTPYQLFKAHTCIQINTCRDASKNTRVYTGFLSSRETYMAYIHTHTIFNKHTSELGQAEARAPTPTIKHYFTPLVIPSPFHNRT